VRTLADHMNFILRFFPKSKPLGVAGGAVAAPRSVTTASEKIVWAFFAVTSCQLAFLHPSFSLIAGERTNLFSGLLCFLTLVAAVALRPLGAWPLKSPEVLCSGALALMAVVSALFSPTPLSSFFRIFVMLASGLGGFWCARLLLSAPDNQRRFTWLCLGILGGLLFLSFLGYFTTGYIEHFICDRSHPLVNVILLLSFAPLSLLREKSRPLMVLGLVLLSLSYVTLCLSQRISVVFIPLGVFLVGAACGALRWKYLVLICLVMVLVVAVFHQKIIWHKLSMTYPYYRVENVPFSWTIIKKHPWVGIGLRAPRQSFLEGYQVVFPGVSKEQFARDVALIVSPDNLFLAMMTGLGLPFTLTYTAALGILMVRLARMALRPPAGWFFHPLILLFPLTAALVHFQLFDGVLFPQSWWFFHILLGLIPLRSGNPGPRGAIREAKA